MAGPAVTPRAVQHLAGRPLVLRASPRIGCCGGRALVPVAEVGPPVEPDRYERRDDGSITCFLDPQLGTAPEGWRVDVAGLGRWRRLQVEGATSVDPSRCEVHGQA